MNDIEERSPSISGKKKGAFRTSTFIVGILLLMVIALAAFVVFQSIKLTEYKDDLQKAKIKISEYQDIIIDSKDIIAELKSENKDLSTFKAMCMNRIEELVPKAYFLDNNIALVTETGEKYHTYDCQYLSDSFYIYIITDAENAGYESCSVCHD